jgi:hypothetical protein
MLCTGLSITSSLAGIPTVLPGACCFEFVPLEKFGEWSGREAARAK